MSEKLDPNLRALVDAAEVGEGDRAIQVIVGLSAPASDQELSALRDRGLQVRSVMGDVLTGSAPVAEISRIAEHPLIVKIEASTPLYPD